MPTMRVPRYLYPAQFEDSIDGLMEELRSMILDGRYILTSEVQQFEGAFADYCETAFARGVNCGTDAIMVALLALGIRIPYFFRPDVKRAARYRAMFGHTHAFLPERNGIVPNTLHVALHAATLATLLILTQLNR